MKKNILLMICLMAITANASVWQWAVSLPDFISPENNNNPEAFLWIPSDCNKVNAVVVGQHNMSEETLFENAIFRNTMSELGFAIVWITPGIDQKWDINAGTQRIFDRMMSDLAYVSGYDELVNVPVVPLGHSAMATFPWNFAAWNPYRTLAIVSLHGDAPRTNLTGYGRDNLEWGKRNIDGIPGLMIQGEYEWWEDRVNPALAFRMMYPKSCISFICDVARGHFDVSDDVAFYIGEFLRKAAYYRIPSDNGALKNIDPTDGWLAQRWHPAQSKRHKPAKYEDYKGDIHDAFWYFDIEMSELTEKRYKESRAKKQQYLGFSDNKGLIRYDDKSHAGFVAPCNMKEDGVTFSLKGVYTDSIRSKELSSFHSDNNISIDRICGPVEVVNDTTFRLSFYRMGMDNPRRSNHIWLVASCKGDGKNKGSVQQINLHVPYRLKGNMKQVISFPEIENVGESIKEIKLNATSDSGLKVYYYVKQGPAVIADDNRVVVQNTPPRSKLPLKVTIVAWQYGISDKYDTAEPVEQSFYIIKD